MAATPSYWDYLKLDQLLDLQHGLDPHEDELLPDELQAPIIVTFHMPEDPRFGFQDFYDRLHDRGYIIYPGKLTVAETFRIGCIGRLGAAEMRGALTAIRETLADMGCSDAVAASA